MRKVPAKSRAALAAALAIAVHVALLLFLVFGVSWQNRHPEPMTVDLVPPLAATKPEPPPKVVEPQPKPEPAPPKHEEPPKVKELNDLMLKLTTKK